MEKRAGVEAVHKAREEDDRERDVEGRGRGRRGGWELPFRRKDDSIALDPRNEALHRARKREDEDGALRVVGVERDRLAERPGVRARVELDAQDGGRPRGDLRPGERRLRPAAGLHARDSERRIAGVPDAHLPHERGVRRDLAEVDGRGVQREPRRRESRHRKESDQKAFPTTFTHWESRSNTELANIKQFAW